MRNVKLAELCVPVGLAQHGRGMFTCPSDLIGQIRVLQRDADEYRRYKSYIDKLKQQQEKEDGEIKGL